MSMPAEAFAHAMPRDRPPGSLFQLRGQWALRVAYTVLEREVAGAVMLEGPHRGRLIEVGQGNASGLCIVSPFAWFPGIDAQTRPSSDGHSTAALTITPVGIAIVGGRPDNFGEVDHIAFGVDGHEIADYQERSVSQRFSRWTIELHHVDRPFTSLGTLGTIDCSASPG